MGTNQREGEVDIFLGMAKIYRAEEFSGVLSGVLSPRLYREIPCATYPSRVLV